eukprot:TRINITY_DN1885_c0_g1_i1.p1 TRINITY_DN1885_c0_g1~~TRINITY_DN1885_c0_g1_i1.p1  ORF type:complete len:772 (+),score=190.79 TRINITY_DN1885_c0_g1_i1:67-2316(+)
MGLCAGREILNAAPLTDGLTVYEGPGPWFTCSPDGVMAPRLSKTGVASSAQTPPTTLPKLLVEAASASGDKVALMVERPCPPQGSSGPPPPALPDEEWAKWTWSEYLADTRKAAKGLLKLGFKAHDAVNVWGFNTPEWMISSFAANFAGGKIAGLYPTDSPETAAFKVVHSGGSVVAIEDPGKLKKLVQGLNDRGDAKRIKAFVIWGADPKEGETATVTGCGEVPVISWKALMERGQDVADSELDARVSAVSPGHCAALIYTSGTTGDPKAVMISHDNIVYESSAVLRLLEQSVGLGATAAQERCLSYLPLSHVAGMMVDIVSPVVLTARSSAWWTIYFARNYDLKAGSVKDRLCAARPTLFLGVPLVWEKIADKIRTLGADVTGAKKAIATWAKGLGLEYAKACQLGGGGSVPLGYSLADTLVLNKVKGNLGLDQCKFGFTGAAPIRVDTLEYFGSLGLSINEVYGMSECCGACTWSLDECHLWGSCGFEMPGQEVKAFIVDPNDINKKKECPRALELGSTDEVFQGELCFRGRNVMMGYMANPDMGSEHVAEIQKKTAAAIDAEGWLHSGDKGLVTKDGMVKITGRYKELIIGDGGENIAPVPIEDHVKKMCDGICEVMMVGDKRKYNVALITLKAKGANGESPGTDDLDAGAARVNPEVKTISAAMGDKTWIDAVTAAIKSANDNPKVCINAAFKIQKFTILPTNFSEENNELTPTKKLKRSVVETRYKDTVDKLYSTDGVYIRYQ